MERLSIWLWERNVSRFTESDGPWRNFRVGSITAAEVNRSPWDRKSLIAHLDIEYVNFDHPAYPYLAPEQIFELQRPVVSAAKSLFSHFRLAPLHLLTGRGLILSGEFPETHVHSHS
jgi:hypothetical protein